MAQSAIEPTRRKSRSKRPEVVVMRRSSRSPDHHHHRRRHHRRRRTREEVEEEEGEDGYVNVYDWGFTKPPPPLRRSTTTIAPGDRARGSRRVISGDVARSSTEKRRSGHGDGGGILRRIISVSHRPDTVDPSRSSRRDRPSMSRSASVRESAAALPSRPSLHRSQTTTRKLRPPATPPPPTTTNPEPPPSTTKTNQRPPSFLGSILGIPKPAPPPPEKQVECLTCLSTYPSSRTALLACSHRMCHSCLRRIFTLSLTDPQHMPPKCCIPDQHIPLKHVDRLFDLKFKMKWNQKYQEYTTKNRLYCPARGCGEWIKPAHIHIDSSGGANTGRKYGKCTRCRTKVCAACNGRWHSSRICPRDDATKQFIEIAKKEGWQRCYNCSATVELKEGCNHMTCRCKAEFCMICGVKWKGCDCPWFNYQAVEQDRLQHMHVPVPRVVVLDGQQEVDENHPRAARGYQAELDARREQERRDEELARRLQALGLEPPGVQAYRVVDIDDNDDEDNGGRFGAHHVWGQTPVDPPHAFVNRTVNGVSVSYHTAARPVLRQHSQASRAYNHRAGAADRVVPRRAATGYEWEAAVHAPLRGATVGVGELRGGVGGVGDGPRGSALAGLTRGGTAEGRVEEWRRWVEVG
ncbi:MAG: hypothetical protein LQ344_006154 [Seirophora lacunosa]|nr:MAG: hypothetical protein LQ344_006154 [Seirophora lacunosa]